MRKRGPRRREGLVRPIEVPDNVAVFYAGAILCWRREDSIPAAPLTDSATQKAGERIVR
jgi:hypothetical protein